MTPAEWQALGLSLQVATVSTVMGMPAAIAFGWLLARKDFPGKVAVDAAISLPLVLPPVVTGYLLLLVFGRKGVLGPLLESVGLSVAFTWKAAAIASAIVGLPLAVRAIRVSIEAVDIGLENAARTLGATPWDVFWSVTLPLARSGLLAGATLAFARSLGEFGATLAFAGNIAGSTRTLPLMIFTSAQTPGGEDAAARLVVISVIVSLGALGVSEWLARRGRGGA
jgi:molybdate transport system permease protein